MADVDRERDRDLTVERGVDGMARAVSPIEIADRDTSGNRRYSHTAVQYSRGITSMSIIRSAKQSLGLVEQPNEYRCNACDTVFESNEDADSRWLKCTECESQDVEVREKRGS